MAPFAARMAPNARVIAPRGRFRLGEGFTFFQRRTDRSLDAATILAEARTFLDARDPAPTPPLVVGYSSGAIFAQALLAASPGGFAGAALLRPEPLAEDFAYPHLNGLPVLSLSGRRDPRRRPTDGRLSARQLRDAGAAVEHHDLDAGHGWAPDDAEARLARRWMQTSGLSDR